MSAWRTRVFAALDLAGLTTADDLGDIPQIVDRLPDGSMSYLMRLRFAGTRDQAVAVRCPACGQDATVTRATLPYRCTCHCLVVQEWGTSDPGGSPLNGS